MNPEESQALYDVCSSGTYLKTSKLLDTSNPFMGKELEILPQYMEYPELREVTTDGNTANAPPTLTDDDFVKLFDQVRRCIETDSLKSYAVSLMLSLAFFVKKPNSKEYIFQKLGEHALKPAANKLLGDLYRVMKKRSESDTSGNGSNSKWDVLDFNPVPRSYSNSEAATIACAYCYFLTSLAAKSDTAVKNRIAKIEITLSQFYSFSVDFSTFAVPDSYLTQFGEMIKNNHLFHYLLIKSIDVASDENRTVERGLLSALALTRLAQHALPLYSASIPIARNFKGLEPDKVMSYIVGPHTAHSVLNYKRFVVYNVLNEEDSKAAMEKYPSLYNQDQRAFSKYWSVARLINDQWITSMGRRDNGDAYMTLIYMQEEIYSTSIERNPDFKIPSMRGTTEKAKKLAKAVLHLIRKEFEHGKYLPEVEEQMRQLEVPKSVDNQPQVTNENYDDL